MFSGPREKQAGARNDLPGVFIAVVIAFSLIVGAFINGAPPLAPLLFPNLAILGLIAISQLRASADERAIS